MKALPSQDRRTNDRNRSKRNFRRWVAFSATCGILLALLFSPAVRVKARALTAFCYSSKRTLSASDIRYLGAIRMPTSGVDTAGAFGGMSGRIVNGQVRFFIYGKFAEDFPIYELADPGSGYSTDYRLAPRANLVTAWGDIYHGKRTSWLPTGAVKGGRTDLHFPLGLFWNDSTRLLYWTYYDPYNTTGDPDWALGASSLDNASTASSTAYGPWRTTATDGDGRKFYGPWRCLYLAADPRDGSMLCGSIITSGWHTTPWGPDLYGGRAWPTASTPGGWGSPDLNLPTRYLEYYFMGDRTKSYYFNDDGSVHGSLRAFRRTTELPIWETFGTGAAQMGPPIQANPALNRGVGSWSGMDVTQGAIWLELGQTRGVIFNASLAGAVSQNSSDCVNAAHEWYANAGVNPPIGACNHGCAPPVGITGPVTTQAFPAFIIYNPDDLEAVKARTRPDYSVDPTSVIDLALTYGIKTAPVNAVGAARTIRGFYFDPIRKYLFVLAPAADDSRAGPVFLENLIHVFAINDGPAGP